MTEKFKISSFYAFDLETTGISIEKDQAVQVAIARFEDGNPVERICRLIKPTCKIQEQAFMVHGIGVSDVADQPELDVVARDIHGFLSRDLPIVTYNGRKFDMPMWKNNCELAGVSPLPVLGRAHIDVFDWVTWNFRSTRYKSLVKMCEMFGLGDNSQNAHHAIHDCIMTGNLLIKMQESSHISSTDFSDFLKKQDSIIELLKKDEDMYSGVLYTDHADGSLRVCFGIHTGKRPEELSLGELRSLIARKYQSGAASETLVSYLKNIANGKKK